MRAIRNPGMAALLPAFLALSACDFQPFQAQKLVSAGQGSDLSLTNGIFAPSSPTPTPTASPSATPVPFEEAIKPFLFQGNINDPLAAYETFVVDGKTYRVDSAKWATRDRSIWIDDGPEQVRYVPAGVTLPATPSLLDLPAYVTNNTVPISGARSAGLAIVVYRDWDEAGQVVASSSTSWSLPVAVSADGDYEFAARAVDSYGVTSIISRTISTTVDLSDPFAPVLTRPNGPMQTGQHLFVEGITGEPGGKVLVEFGGSTTEVQVNSEGSGGFVHDAGVLTTAGSFPLSVITVAPSGRRSPATTDTVVVDDPL